MTVNYLHEKSQQGMAKEMVTTPVFLPENPMDRGARQAIVHRVTKSQPWLNWLGMHRYITPSEILISEQKHVEQACPLALHMVSATPQGSGDKVKRGSENWVHNTTLADTKMNINLIPCSAWPVEEKDPWKRSGHERGLCTHWWHHARL